MRRRTPRLFTSENMRSCSCRVPQQDNSSDCGLYLLQYVESFLQVNTRLSTGGGHLGSSGGGRSHLGSSGGGGGVTWAPQEGGGVTWARQEGGGVTWARQEGEESPGLVRRGEESPGLVRRGGSPGLVGRGEESPGLLRRGRSHMGSSGGGGVTWAPQEGEESHGFVQIHTIKYMIDIRSI